jgi:hypothetical protein
MPFIGLGLHVLVALFFAVHVVRNGQPLYWLIILFSFPMLGSAVYFVAVYLPQSRLQQGARKVAAAAARTLDPGRELREARAALGYTPSATNQMRLAKALLECGEAEEAAVNYEACLKGPFATDPEIKFCAARAFVESGRFAAAVAHLEETRAANPSFRAEQLSVLIARALAGANRDADARAEFETALQRFGSFDVRAEYAIWALLRGDKATAARMQAEMAPIMERWNPHTRTLNMPMVRRLQAAVDEAKKRGL